MIHQSFYISKHIMQLYFDRFYQVHLEEQDKKLHNMKILYQLLPIYLQKMIRWIVVVLIRI